VQRKNVRTTSYACTYLRIYELKKSHSNTPTLFIVIVRHHYQSNMVDNVSLMIAPHPPYPNLLRSAHPVLIAIVRRHFERKGYHVRSSLQFGCKLVLYANSPGRVHSDFCIRVPPPPPSPSFFSSKDDDNNEDGSGSDGSGTILDWRMVQTLARSMPDLRKTLIVACTRWWRCSDSGRGAAPLGRRAGDGGGGSSDGPDGNGFNKYEVDELAIATEHLPFWYKNVPLGVGMQVKPLGGQQLMR
jgi:hypothetical protein